MNCIACKTKMNYWMSKVLIEKYEAEYFRCKNCGMIRIKDPYWLTEAYSNPELELRLDTGRFNRAKYNANFTNQFIQENFINKKMFLDFGCGQEGIFVKQMREKGHEFFGYDKYHTKVAFHKELSGKYAMITAFEVFEHLTDPIETIKTVMQHTDIFMIGTMMPNKNTPPSPTWNYYSPKAGQHIIFYTQETFENIAKNLDLDVDFYNKNSMFGNIAVLLRS